MKSKLNILVIAPLVSFIALVPIFCCCFMGQTQAHAQSTVAVATSHKCCDSPTKNDHPQHGASKCDCSQHSLAKAINVASGTLDALSVQNHLGPYQINFLALVSWNSNPRYVSAYQAVHSPPLHSSNPFYLEFRTLRL